MLYRRSVIYKIAERIHRIKVKILWLSQKKSFKAIGLNSSVLEPLYLMGAEFISIGDNFHCGKDVRLEAWSQYETQKFTPQIIIGNNVMFTDRCYLSCINRIEINDNVLFGRDVFVADNSHGDIEMIDTPPAKRHLTSKGPVKIGKNVWVGRQVTILSGVSIGENSIIGANSVVNKDIPPNCVAAGNPAIVLKYRNAI